jgi:hypothetical protein
VSCKFLRMCKLPGCCFFSCHFPYGFAAAHPSDSNWCLEFCGSSKHVVFKFQVSLKVEVQMLTTHFQAKTEISESEGHISNPVSLPFSAGASFPGS